MPVVPATQESEVQELLAPRRQRAVITPLHSSLGDRVRPEFFPPRLTTRAAPEGTEGAETEEAGTGQIIKGLYAML